MEQSKVFVGNISFRLPPEDLRALFEQAGPVEDVYFPTDRESGRRKGFAFVTFGTAEAAAEAISKFDGYDLEGRELKVNEARPREDRGPGGGGGGGGGGGFRSGGGGGGGPRREFRGGGDGDRRGGGGGGPRGGSGGGDRGRRSFSRDRFEDR
ncbi:MAG: RNA recognition motif domain-containing protein [Puniceicoccaceae bacterium]